MSWDCSFDNIKADKKNFIDKNVKLFIERGLHLILVLVALKFRILTDTDTDIT